MGALMRERRKALDLSQHKLAQRAGVSPHTVKYLERGWLHTPGESYRPQRKSLIRLSGTLAVPLDRMLDAYGYDTGTREKVQFTVAGLTPEQVERVREFIEELKNE